MITKWIMGRDKIQLSSKDRSTHTYVIGQPGSGKSRAIESWVMQDIKAGRAVGVIDPHGDLYNNLLARLAADPLLWEKIVLFDPLDEKWVVGFNPLDAVTDLPKERLAIYMTDIVIKVWKIQPEHAPRMVWLLTNTFLALSSTGLTIVDLPRFLTDPEFRKEQLPRVRSNVVRSYFLNEYPQKQSSAMQWAAPILNKLGNLIFDPQIRAIFTGKSTINFRHIMDNGKILLIHLPKGIMGEELSSLLAAFIVAMIQKAALSRASTNKRQPFYLYLDEFQNYTTNNIKDILSESRKYSLSMTMAHQYLDQLSFDLRSAVLNTIGTMVCFRVGNKDASTLVKEIFPSPEYIQSRGQELRLRSVNSILLPMVIPKIQATNWDTLTRELVNLEMREFWFRKRGLNQPIKQYTFDMPDPVLTTEIKRSIHMLRDSSGERYARLRSDLKPEDTNVDEKSTIPKWSN
jgi:type IV secretory pathway TraG/TraD family ATPase VirD4